jgi:hypothetical protein
MSHTTPKTDDIHVLTTSAHTNLLKNLSRLVLFYSFPETKPATELIPARKLFEKPFQFGFIILLALTLLGSRVRHAWSTTALFITYSSACLAFAQIAHPVLLSCLSTYPLLSLAVHLLAPTCVLYRNRLIYSRVCMVAKKSCLKIAHNGFRCFHGITVC